MGSNLFGNIFRFMTWGESHGKAIGVVIDGCPSCLELSEKDINDELFLRSPGRSRYVSKRKENDKVEILSGVFEGKTTGAPISIIIYNNDVDSSKYDDIKNIYRPGHSNFTYIEKYKVYDHRGGGRSSGRETASMVAVGAIAKKILKHFNIEVISYLKSIFNIEASVDIDDVKVLKDQIMKSEIFCPDGNCEKEMIQVIEKIRKEKNSVGGVVEFVVNNLPCGLGDPVYEKLNANLAKALLSIPAAKGFEIGEGYLSNTMKGSSFNDSFVLENNKVKTKTNHAGGVLGGISNSMPIIGRVHFKPTPTIGKQQESLEISTKKAKKLKLLDIVRHDPCIAIRATKVVEAMVANVIVDALLMNRVVNL